MDNIRPFIVADIPAVASLFQRVFRHEGSRVPDSLKSYFDEIYFKNPWVDPEMPSLVFENDIGKIAGFLGVVPLKFKFRGKAAKAAISGNYMVDPELRDPFAGIRILKRFFSGAQDISMTDTGNETSRKIWEGIGATTSIAHSMHWIRILNPLGYSASFLREKKILSPVELLIRPFASLVDTGFVRFSFSPIRLEKPSGFVKDMDSDELFEAISKAAPRRSFVPDYDRESLTWLHRKAMQKNAYGKLCSLGVYRSDGSLEGWFLYYPNANKTGQVLQLATLSNSIGNVLDHLFSHAIGRGSKALIGRMEPLFVKEFTGKRCLFFHRSHYFFMKTNNIEIQNAINNGDAFLSRLEGEWWTKFQGDTFS